jgi:hypothetical protein
MFVAYSITSASIFIFFLGKGSAQKHKTIKALSPQISGGLGQTPRIHKPNPNIRCCFLFGLICHYIITLCVKDI